MTTARRRLCLATESPDPSGVGMHMLTLAHGLGARYEVTIAAPRDSPLIAQAAATGLNVLVPRRNRPRAARPGCAWDRARLAGETVRLLGASGPEIGAQIITHVVRIDDAPDFLARLVAERPEFLQIVFKVAD